MENINSINTISLIKSRKVAKSHLSKLEKKSLKTWGELFWINKNFQKSKTAQMMEFYNAEINYYTNNIHQYINYN